MDVVPSIMPLYKSADVLMANDVNKMLLNNNGSTVIGLFKFLSGDRTSKYNTNYIPFLQIKGVWSLEISNSPNNKEQAAARLNITISDTITSLKRSANENFLRPLESTLTWLSGLCPSSLRPALVGVAVDACSSLFLPCFPLTDPFRDPPLRGIRGNFSFFFSFPAAPSVDFIWLDRLLLGGNSPPPLTVGGFFPLAPRLVRTPPPLSRDFLELFTVDGTCEPLFLMLCTL